MKFYAGLSHQCVTILICAIILSLLITAGCTSKKVSESGFLYDYSNLQPDPMDKEEAMFWIDNQVSLKDYKKFIIDPISFHFAPEMQDQAKNVDANVLNDISDYFRKAIVKSLAPEFSVVDTPGHDVARLRIGLTTISVDRKDLKAYQYIPVALVITGVSEAAGARDKMAVLGMEGEAKDSISGKRFAAVVQKKGVEVKVKEEGDLTAADVYPTLDYWAEKMKKRMLSVN